MATVAAVVFVLGTVDEFHRVPGGIGSVVVGGLLTSPLVPNSWDVVMTLVVGGGTGVLPGLSLLWLAHRTTKPDVEG